MENKISENPIDYQTPNSLASVWSMMLPGLGQLMKGQVLAGIFWAFFTAGGYFAYFWPGLLCHSLCVLDAAFNKGEGSFLGLHGWKKVVAYLLFVAALLSYIYFRN